MLSRVARVGRPLSLAGVLPEWANRRWHPTITVAEPIIEPDVRRCGE